MMNRGLGIVLLTFFFAGSVPASVAVSVRPSLKRLERLHAAVFQSFARSSASLDEQISLEMFADQIETLDKVLKTYPVSLQSVITRFEAFTITVSKLVSHAAPLLPKATNSLVVAAREFDLWLSRYIHENDITPEQQNVLILLREMCALLEHFVFGRRASYPQPSSVQRGAVALGTQGLVIGGVAIVVLAASLFLVVRHKLNP